MVILKATGKINGLKSLLAHDLGQITLNNLTFLFGILLILILSKNDWPNFALTRS